MQLTTKSIIKILPLEEKHKVYLLEEFDKLEPARKYAVTEFLWNAYDALYELKLQENMQKALNDPDNTAAKLDKDFYKTIKKQTHEQMEQDALAKTQNVDLSQARKALEVIVKEIQASKKPSKH
ncbi:MAG TPA: hypothetical protein VLF68_01325 [Candidatus Saccharimonadales bacterium]|nr:hypothetical protein [Candidatus Saccharimonadales bacterium]